MNVWRRLRRKLIKSFPHRNNLRRLQREAREEKLARNRAGLSGTRASNLSPSCLSSTSRPRSPSPPCLSDEEDQLLETPCKRPRLLLFDDDKENNEMELDEDPKAHLPSPAYDGSSGTTTIAKSPADTAQEILRDLYETCVNESVQPRSPSPELENTISLSASCSLTTSSNNSSSSCENNDSNGECWPRHSHFPFNCGQSSLLGNDLQSVVFHSLITSLES